MIKRPPRKFYQPKPNGLESLAYPTLSQYQTFHGHLLGNKTYLSIFLTCLNKHSKEGASSNEQIEALKENEESYRSIFEHMEVGAAIFEPINGSQDCVPKLNNKSAEAFLGFNGKRIKSENSPESLSY